jgi:hypothetical protein
MHLRFPFVAVLAVLIVACAPEDDSVEGSKAACEGPCASCANALDSCKLSCAGVDQGNHDLGCGDESRAYLSCLTSAGACYSDQANAEYPACPDERAALDDCR